MGIYVIDCKIGKISVEFDHEKLIEIRFINTNYKNEYENNINHKYEDDILAFINGDTSHIDVPYDLRGTPFQMKVWAEIAQIPTGQTRSYSEIAKSIGHPGAYRAVGTACKKNPLPLLIPCHRVIRSDGMIGYYAGGDKLKKLLLMRERNH